VYVYILFLEYVICINKATAFEHNDGSTKTARTIDFTTLLLSEKFAS